MAQSRPLSTAITLRRGTSVYDGIAAGVSALGDEGSRSILVLSDGADTGSTTTLEVLSREAADAEVVVDVVSLAEAARAAELAGLADATSGSVIPADPAALSAVFGSQAEALSQQLLVSFEPPADVTTDASVDVTLTSAGQTYHDSALVAFVDNGTQLDVVDSGKALVSKPVMLLGARALAIGLGGLMMTILIGATDSRSCDRATHGRVLRRRQGRRSSPWVRGKDRPQGLRRGGRGQRSSPPTSRPGCHNVWPAPVLR